MAWTNKQIERATERMHAQIESLKDVQGPKVALREHIESGLDDVPAFLDEHPHYAAD